MMRNVVLGFILLLVVMMASCAQCNICKIDTDEINVCTNSILDRAKAKANCNKEGGEWIKIKKL